MTGFNNDKFNTNLIFTKAGKLPNPTVLNQVPPSKAPNLVSEFDVMPHELPTFLFIEVTFKLLPEPEDNQPKEKIIFKQATHIYAFPATGSKNSLVTVGRIRRRRTSLRQVFPTSSSTGVV